MKGGIREESSNEETLPWMHSTIIKSDDENGGSGPYDDETSSMVYHSGEEDGGEDNSKKRRGLDFNIAEESFEENERESNEAMCDVTNVKPSANVTHARGRVEEKKRRRR